MIRLAKAIINTFKSNKERQRQIIDEDYEEGGYEKLLETSNIEYHEIQDEQDELINSGLVTWAEVAVSEEKSEEAEDYLEGNLENAKRTWLLFKK